MALDGAGRHPASGCIRGKIEEAAIIFGISNHYQRVMPLFGRGRDERRHHQLAKTAALEIGQDRDRTNERHRRHRAARILERHGPALQRPDQPSVVESGKAQGSDGVHPVPHTIGRSRPAIGTERCIEQRFDVCRFDPAQRGNFNHKSAAQ